MKQHDFRVEFALGEPGVGPYVTVTAFNGEQARILAQAERIKRGLDYEVVSVVRVG